MSDTSRPPGGTPADSGLPAERVDPNLLRESVVAAMKTVYDPEIPVDIWELGLIYALEIDDSGMVRVKMTLTSPMCPVAGSLPGEVEQRVREVEGVRDVDLELVWDPPWSMERMSDPAKLKLGFM
jgi:FeS assembly SUF system protein